MKKIAIFYEGWGERWHLATLADNGRQLLFEYTPQALQQGLELSPRHLKLQATAYGQFPDHQMGLPGLVSDALPDGWGLLLMDRVFRQNGLELHRLSVLDRLAFIGQRALGALTFEPATPADLPHQDTTLLTLAQQAHAIVGGADSDMLRQLALIGGSPHGARPKVLVHYAPDSGHMSTHPFAGSQPWLVKFQAANEHKEACTIETLYAELARACGLSVPATRHFDLDDQLAGFGIQRFDVCNGQRVPVHTLSGLLHANFRLPGAVDYTTFLRATRFLTQDEREVQKAYERAVFNVLFHNRDDHPKNFSFLLTRERRWTLAPAYDLTFCEGPGGWHQMDVCGEGQHIARHHMLKLAEQGGLRTHWAAQVLDRQLSVATSFSAYAQPHPIRLATQKLLAARVADNAQRLAHP